MAGYQSAPADTPVSLSNSRKRILNYIAIQIQSIKVHNKNNYTNNKIKCRQHPDFPGGHPPEYYPSLRLLNFTEQTGYGDFSLRWPSTTANDE